MDNRKLVTIKLDELMERGNNYSNKLDFSKIIWGVWSIGKDDYAGIDEQDAYCAIKTAIELGFTTFDTAPSYGFGLSEEILGNVINNYDRSSIQLITKCGFEWQNRKGSQYFSSFVNTDGRKRKYYLNLTKEGIIDQCNDSLKRLKTDYIDLYSVHIYNQDSLLSEIAEAMTVLKKDGKILYSGVSNYSLKDFEELNSHFDLVSNKRRYNLLNRIVEQEVPFYLANDKFILAYDVLQRGILTGRDYPPFYFKNDDPKLTRFYKPENKLVINELLNALTLIAIERNCTLTQLSIAWVLHQSAVSSVILAATSSLQVVDDARSGDVFLSQDDLGQINMILEELLPKLK
ncbi:MULTISPECIES: aldo/keto reductase [Sphingobacterium]|uniref:aldo/keto reductase n=1 Tax=Sphingobacterium TaxID=28453 RepID=UPI00257E266B|nr:MULTISPECIES: aldo/keto reductase [Sphingobacterium]